MAARGQCALQGRCALVPILLRRVMRRGSPVDTRPIRQIPAGTTLRALSLTSPASTPGFLARNLMTGWRCSIKLLGRRRVAVRFRDIHHGAGNQSSIGAHFCFDRSGDVGIVAQELLGVLTPLANPLAVIVISRRRIFRQRRLRPRDRSAHRSWKCPRHT